jgi:hypothetical protein
MTHVKNTEAFARLIGFCKGYGGRYNPGRSSLQVDALINQLSETQSVIELVKMAKTNLDNEVNLRKQTYHALPALISSILRTLEASGAKHEKVKDARMFVHHIIRSSLRNRAPLTSDNKEEAIAQHSHLQLAYVSKADAFSKLVLAVSSEPLYQPRENNFSQAGLEVKILELNQLNRQVANAQSSWRKSIIERNAIMYRQELSMTKTARAVKKYVRAIYGLNSEEYALVKTLSFNTAQR